MTLPNTVVEYSTHAAQSFIQTAVFIDDRIYERSSVSTTLPNRLNVPRTRKKATKSVSEDGDHSVTAPAELYAEEDASPDTYDIVTSFAKKQIVCCLYQPKQQAKVSPGSDIFPLCKAADVVVVDWDLFGDKGERALELVDGLVKQAVHDVPEQLRLIIVYTQEPNLFSVADELYQKVYETLGENFSPLEGEGGLAFHTQNSRVSVLGKPGRTRPNVGAEYVVEECDLADVTVREFAKLASGLLHAATLLGLAEIRKNSRKVLSKFNEELDPAFLTHLAMCQPEEQASSHIIPLLISEIGSVLEDALPSPIMSDELLKDWCKNIWSPGTHLADILGADKDYRAIGEAILTNGFTGARNVHNCIPKIGNNANARKASKIFIRHEDDNTNHRLAHLISSRTFYGDVPKALSLGTIVFDENCERYLLCLQPVCDSVRIGTERNFLFTELDVAVEAGQGAATHVVVKPDGVVLELFYRSKSYCCVIAKFRPSAVRDQVIAKSVEDEQPLFVDMSGANYRWIDQLNTAHAQRAVEYLASDLSRVGLTESEWLRLLQRK